MGVVYNARQVVLNRTVALKMILSGDYAGAEEKARFKREAEAIARLQHPDIVSIYEVGEHHGTPFFSLEFCPGGSLADRLQGTPMEPPEAARLVQNLAEAAWPKTSDRLCRFEPTQTVSRPRYRQGSCFRLLGEPGGARRPKAPTLEGEKGAGR